MECVNKVILIGYVILAVLVLVGLGSVGIHALWSRNLQFVDFNRSNLSNKHNLKRLFLPSVIAAGLGMFVPILFVLASSPLRRCLEDSSLGDFLPSVMRLILPVEGTGIFLSALVCASIGFAWYWIIGVTTYLISTKVGRY